MKKKVILVAGMPGSGKSVLSEAAKELGLPVLSMGDILRKEAKKRGLPLTDKVLGKLALNLRRVHGEDYVARVLLKEIQKLKNNAIVVEGVRSLKEVNSIRTSEGKVIVLSIHSSPITRYKRLIRRGRDDDPRTWDEFVERDMREISIGISDVIALSDRMIVNEGISREELKKICLNELRRVIDDC